MTKAGSGLSTQEDHDAALTEALDMALASLGGAEAKLGLLFCGPKRPLAELLKKARDRLSGADIMGCTTAGELTEKGLVHNGISVFLLAGDGFSVVSRFSEILLDDPDGAGADLCDGFDDGREEAQGAGQKNSLTIVLADGLVGTNEDTIAVMSAETGPFQAFVGGAAGDEGAFKETLVGLNKECNSGSMAVAHVFSEQAWTIGTGHGLKPASETMRVTRAVGNVVYELDGQPAFEAYKEHASSRGVELEASAAGPYMIAHELGLYFFEKVSKARAPLSVNEDGSLNLAASLKEGASVCILDGDPGDMVQAARAAAEEAKAQLGDRKVAGVILFDCVCRGIILADGFSAEIAAVQEVFGDVPIAGFLTYGEIARARGQFEGWHNTTAVVLAIPE